VGWAFSGLIPAGDFTKTLDKADEIVYIRLSYKNYLDQGGHYGNLFGKTRRYKKELACG
jgi:hypothetical protein